MVDFKNITKVYGNIPALSVESLTIHEHDCVGIVGNNGAGKTTMLSLILDLIKPTTGLVYSKGVPVSTTDKWKYYTGSYLNEGFLLPFLTPMEFLELTGGLYCKNLSDLDCFLTENKHFYTDDIRSKKFIRSLSSGNKNKIGILSALLPSPEIVILDEPFANLDPGSQSWLKEKLGNLHNSGTTMIISSHDLLHITEICSRIIVLEDGRIVMDTITKAETYNELESYFRRK
jgi:ABC-2 type transport system ATP-binding protein